MISGAASRIVQTGLALVVTSIIVFVGVYLIGEPTALYDPLVRDDPEKLAAVREELGLNLPLYKQYLIFVTNVFSGDFGQSWVFQEPVLKVILERLPATLELVFLAMAIAISLGFPLGLLAGLNKGRWYAVAVERVAVLGYSTPTFWIGLILIYTFAVGFEVLPSIGRGDTVEIFGVGWSLFTADGLSHLILPAITLSLYEIGYIARMTSTLTQEAMTADYVRFATAKGLTPSQLVRRHVIKNISIPLITIITIETGALVAGSVVTESLFGWPGVGKLLVDSVAALDRPVIVAFMLLATFFFLMLNMVADITYHVIDPRLSRRGSSQ